MKSKVHHFKVRIYSDDQNKILLKEHIVQNLKEKISFNSQKRNLILCYKIHIDSYYKVCVSLEQVSKDFRHNVFMGVKVFSNNMDEPNLKEALKKNDIEELNNLLSKLSKKTEHLKTLFKEDIEEENVFAYSTLDKFNMFNSFVLCQTIIVIILGIYQIFLIKNKLVNQF